MIICKVCKTEIKPEDLEPYLAEQGYKVHKGYCSEVMVEIMTKDLKQGELTLTESSQNELDEYQLL